MLKFVVIPDSFKGTLSSKEACDIIKQVIQIHYPSANIVNIPIADGGEGTLDCLSEILPGKHMNVNTTDVLNKNIKACYFLHENTAIIEVAKVIGITLVNELNPYKYSTYGLGNLVKDAINKGAKNIVFALGGTSNNDGGTNFIRSLGGKFLDINKNEIIPDVYNYKKIVDIDISSINQLLKYINITIMSDVTNPYYGLKGATYIFGKQKGVLDKDMPLFDDYLKHIADIIKDKYNIDLQQIPGSGAAGGLGGIIASLLHGKIESGIETILNLVNFDNIIKDASLVFTGEGKIDNQSIDGKVISGIGKRCKKANVNCIALTGCIDNVPNEIYSLGISSIFSINQKAEDFSISKSFSKENLYNEVDHILRLIKLYLKEDN